MLPLLGLKIPLYSRQYTICVYYVVSILITKDKHRQPLDKRHEDKAQAQAECHDADKSCTAFPCRFDFWIHEAHHTTAAMYSRQAQSPPATNPNNAIFIKPFKDTGRGFASW